MRSVESIIAAGGLCLLLSCKSGKKETAPLFSLMENTGISFQNTVVDNDTDNSFQFRNFYNGGGVAIGDINNDGLSDVLLTSNMGENKLYLNKGGLTFDDITPNSGMRQDSMWSTGVVFADINDDGWLDIYICNSGRMSDGNRRNKLYINNRNLTFTEQSREYGLDHSGYCTQASFFDYDLDGDLDCFIINNSPLPFSSLNYAGMRDADIAQWQVSDELKGGGNHLFRNDMKPGDTSGIHFIEVTKAAGLHTGLISFGLGVSIGDINNDGYPDIYVGNDFIEKDYLYINQKNGTFSDDLEKCMQHISMSSMSTDLADINNDGHPEIFTTDMIPDDDYRLKTTGTFDNVDLYNSKLKAGLYHQFVRNTLQLNNRDGSFTEIANRANVYGTDWSWGAVLFDADNDGYNDIYVCNGINKDLSDLDFLDFFSNDVYQRMLETGKRDEISEILRHIPVTPLPNRVFRNTGNLDFEDVGSNWGFDKATFSNSIAYGDLDNDGDLDLVINNENQPSFVYRNNSREQTGNNYIAIQLRGQKPNGFAIGSKIKIYIDSSVYYRELAPSRGFQSCMDYKQVIGIGKQNKVDSVEIIWPDRTYNRYYDVAINKQHVITKPSTGLPAYKEHLGVDSTSTTLLPTAINLEKHTEDEHLDFYYERNLPELLSREGPQIGVADVNGDGREDMYIGGAKGQEGNLYIQDASGSFSKKPGKDFSMYVDFEEVAILFFDADKDGDADLFIGAGGNNMEKGSRTAQHRLYKNDGQGNFAIDFQAFPENDMNIAIAVANDYDEDGDQDLYIGSRSVPYQYGISPVSYIYNNDGNGHFTDVTTRLNAQLATAGMITAADWADLNGDGKKELVICGEWMTPEIYSYDKGAGKMIAWKNTGLEKYSGWWQTVKTGDLNGDGKPDLVLGNIGENFYLRPGFEQPVKLWLNDFDKSGTIDAFLTRSIKGRDMPVFLKREITEQFPALKKQNLRHSEYASKSIQELFGDEMVSTATEKVFNFCSSVIAFNKGDGTFEIVMLPIQTQFSSVHAVAMKDMNADGHMDLLLGGNKFGFPPQFGRLDGSYGHVLLNNGKGSMTWLPSLKSGMSIRGEIKDIRGIRINNRDGVIIGINNERPVIYILNKDAQKSK